MVAELTSDNRALKDVLSKKLVAPAGLRAVVSYVEVQYEMSERHACRLMGLGRIDVSLSGTKADRDSELRTRLCAYGPCLRIEYRDDCGMPVASAISVIDFLFNAKARGRRHCKKPTSLIVAAQTAAQRLAKSEIN